MVGEITSESVDSHPPVLSLQEAVRIILFCLWNVCFVVLCGELIRNFVDSTLLFHGLSTATILLTAQVHLGYFYYREHHPRPLDPYITEKLYIFSFLLLILFWTYDLRSANFLKLSAITLLGMICLFYFCRYIEGVEIEPAFNLEDYDRSPEFFSAYIKNLWYYTTKSLVLASSIGLYLIYVDFLPSVQFIILLAVMGLYAPVTVAFLYRRSVRKYSPPDSDRIRSHVLNFYRYSELYPTNDEILLIEQYKQSIKSVGGDTAIRIIRLIQDKSFEDPLTEWERNYQSLAEDLFLAYFYIVYLSPLMWLFLDLLPLLYAVVPAYDLGLYGLSVVFAGSLFLAVEPLSSIPGTGKVQDARLAAYTHFGVLLLATGTIFQISSQLNDVDVLSSFERSNFLLYLSPELISTILALVTTITPFVAIPFLVVIALRSTEDEVAPIAELNQQQMTLDTTYWERKAEQESKTMYVGPIGSFDERISVLVVSRRGNVKFAVNLEQYHTEAWHLVARFEHAIRESNSIDILSDGLQMFVYQDEAETEVVNGFPQLDLIDAHLYCELFLMQHAEHLLSQYREKSQLTAKSSNNKTSSKEALLTLPYKNGGRVTINGTAHDLRERQTKIIAWGTNETVGSIVQRVNRYDMPDLSDL